MKSLMPFAGLIAACILFLTSSGWSQPLMVNGSFEIQGDAPTPTGILTPPGWIAVGNCGINPVQAGFESVPTIGGRNPYADNGLIPDGTHVAFIDGTPFNGAKSGLFQVIPGITFESNKTYVLQWHANAQASKNRSATMIVVLGDHTLLNWHPVAAVEGAGKHTKPYSRRTSIEFKTNTAAPLLLRVSGSSAQANPSLHPSLPSDNAGNYRYECTMLVDDFRWIELGPLKLLSARRNYTNHTEVTAEFDGDLSDASITNVINYVIPGVTVLSAKKGATARQVILTTSPIQDGSSPNLTAEGVLALDGRGMFRANATRPIDVTPRDPIDFTLTIAGMQDDFINPVRDPNWRVYGADVYAQTYGLLKVGTATGKGNVLLYEMPEYGSSVQEVLAKVRITAMDAGGRAGISVSSRGNATEGVQGLFAADAAGRKTRLLDLKGKQESPAGPAWNNGIWYWLRLRYEPGTDGKHAAQTRLWPADGETVEPSTWQTLATPNVSSGFAGIAAGEDGLAAEMELDYFLVKAEGLPQITPTLPTGVQPFLEITRKGSDVQLRWPFEGTEGLVLQKTFDVGMLPAFWEPVDVTAAEADGTYNILTISPSDPMLFFRLSSP